jgi:hypothetical protein
MPYNMPYKSLGSRDLAFLLDPNSRTAKIIFVDCLAMIHDVLAALGSNPDHPLFVQFGQSIDSGTIHSVTNNFPPGASNISDNILTNADTAFDLRQQIISSAPKVPLQVARDLVDDYLDKLLRQYGFVR